MEKNKQEQHDQPKRRIAPEKKLVPSDRDEEQNDRPALITRYLELADLLFRPQKRVPFKRQHHKANDDTPGSKVA